MKRLIIALTIAASLAFHAASQTNNIANTSSNAAVAIGLSTNTAAGVSATLNYFVDAAPYFTNGNVMVEVGALKVGSKYGEFIDLQLPVDTNSWQITYGVSAAYVDHQLYSGALNVTLGTTVNVP